MRLSLLWVALGLLATSSGQGSGQVSGQDSGQSSGQGSGNVKMNEHMCKKYKQCSTTTTTTTATTTENPSVDDNNCTCKKRSECRNSTATDSNPDDGNYGEDEIDLRQDFGLCTYLETCCKTEDIIPPEPIHRTSKECGLRNFEGIGFRIIGNNNEAQYAEFPWVVGIKSQNQAKPTNGKAFLSVGSLIHPQVVLTAAHHVEGKSNLMVVAGEWDTETENEPYPTQNGTVRKVIVHEKLVKRWAYNDVALLILEQPFDTSAPHVKTICLPDPGENMDGRNCVASGWGKDKFGEEGRYQAILKKVDDLPMVPRSQCQEALRKTRLGPGFRLHESFVCAGGIIGKDTCKGDGGGPLICPSKTNPEKYVQAGITAWGIGCDNGNPGVYVDVPHFVNWIVNKLAAEDISIDP